MDTLRTIKKISLYALVIAALLPAYSIECKGAHHGSKPQCPFTQQHLETLEIISRQSPGNQAIFEEANNYYLALYSDLKEMVRQLVDPSVEPGPIRADYYDHIKTMVMEDFVVILTTHANNFKNLAIKIGERTPAGNKLMEIGRSLHEMGKVFLKHMAVCEELARKDKGEGYTREDGIAVATTVFRMQKLKKDLQPFAFLMPAELDGLSFTQWQKIIASLY